MGLVNEFEGRRRGAILLCTGTARLPRDTVSSDFRVFVPVDQAKSDSHEHCKRYKDHENDFGWQIAWRVLDLECLWPSDVGESEGC